MLPTAASFLLSESCNLGCKYCFELPERDNTTGKNMPDEVIRQGIDYLIENSTKEQKENRAIELMIFGGEPLINYEGLATMLSYSANISDATGISVRSGLITNATLLEEHMVPMLREHSDSGRLTIQISVDGIKEVHDKVRVFKNGSGSFDLIESKIPLIKEIIKNADMNDVEGRDRVTVHSSMTKHVLPYMFESYLYFTEKWGIPGVWFMPIHQEEWDDKDVEIYDDQLNKIADYIMGKCETEKTVKYLTDFAPLNKALNRPQKEFGLPCGAGRSFVSITANGDIYPCHQFYYIEDTKKELIIGNVWDGIDESKRRIFKEYDGDDLTCHSKLDCTAYHCYRCIAENYVDNKSIVSTKITSRCKMTWTEQKLIQNIRNRLEEMGYQDMPRRIEYGDCEGHVNISRNDINNHFSLLSE